MPQQSTFTKLGQPFIELQSVDSTNNYALERIHAGLARHGEVIFTREQTAGKGQRGKTWLTEKESNIILSITFQPSALKPRQQFQLSACMAIGLRDFFSKYGGPDTSIKWPNDLYWQDRKAGGILIESVIKASSSYSFPAESWDWAVVGIGVNINQTSFPPELKNPVSLKQITGKNFSVHVLARDLVSCIETRLNQLVNSGFMKIYEDYLTYLYKKGQKVRLRKDNRVFEVKLLGVSPDGKLLVKNGMEQEFNFGEIEFER